MKITRLELTDYKCFEHLALDNLGDRVVLVGPNGCGKSAILEAIAVLKEYIGTYDPNQNAYFQLIPVLNKHTTAWRSNVPLPIRSNQPAATIKVHLALNEAERAIVRGKSEVDAAVRIDRTLEVIPTMSDPEVRTLFRSFDSASKIGIFDYISPDRQYRIQQVKTLDMSRLSVDSQRRERIELLNPETPGVKFTAIKQFIIASQLEDLSLYNATGERRNSIELLQELFNSFFAPKKLLGFKKNDDELQIVVQTPYGEHDIDQLSSGEKELFTIFVNLFRIRDFPGVILYDEPERHLNPGLQAKIIPALDLLHSKNQLWIATHGTELVGSVPLIEIVALHREAGASEPERFVEESKTAKVHLFEEIGAQVGLQLASNRIVFLEGKEANSDKRILDRLVGPRLPGVLFIASGPSSDVQAGGTRAALLLEEASKDASFMMVLDRDYRDDDSVEDLSKRLNSRAFIWSCHEVENLLLDANAIFEVLRFNDCLDHTQSPEDVREALKRVAESLADRFAVEWAAYRINYAMNNARLGSPKDDDGYLKMIISRREQLAQTYSETRTMAELNEAKDRVKRSLRAGTWAVLLPGKEILDGFRKAYLGDLSSDIFHAQIVSAIVGRKIIPAEAERLCQFIQAM